MSLINSVSAMFSHFNFLDYVMLGFMSCAMLLGGIKGFCRQIVTWFFWLVAGYIGYYHAVALSEVWLVSVTSVQLIRVGLIVFGLMLMAMMCNFVLNRIMQGLLQATGMVVFDRFLGVYLGLVQAVVMVAILVTGFTATSVRHEMWWQESRVVAMTTALVPIYATDSKRLVDQAFTHIHALWSNHMEGQLTWGVAESSLES